MPSADSAALRLPKTCLSGNPLLGRYISRDRAKINSSPRHCGQEDEGKPLRKGCNGGPKQRRDSLNFRERNSACVHGALWKVLFTYPYGAKFIRAGEYY